MAALPPLTQLGGNQRSLFEGYWTMLDPKNTGKVDAGTAATFMKKSQLREPVLHKIWNMSDPGGKGHLDKQGLFMALRLIATCQAGKEPQVANMALSDPPPKFVGVDVPVSAAPNKWTIEEAERTKYEKMFQGLQPSKGLLGGDKARPLMLQSKLPRDTLGKIWGLSDIDKDGSLDLDEFCVAMKLISLAQSGEVLSASLPASLIPPSKSISTSTTASTGGVVAPPTSTSAGGILTAAMLPIPTSLTPTPADSSPSHGSPVPPKKLNPTPLAPPPDVEWVVSADLKSKYDGYFQGIDKDHDGYVSGEEARSLFMASNLQQPVLAHIWNLCDIEKNGKLNAEQFALAMYLIAEKVRKKDPPKELTPAMIPPSLRSKVPPSQASSSTSSLPSSSSSIATVASSSGAFSTSTTMATTSTPLGGKPSSTIGGEGAGFGFSSDFSAIQELDSISNEVEAIRKEKLELAEDIKAKQELIQQRKAEMEGFQENVDAATKQRMSLEKEKEEARNMLEQLNNEKAKFEGQIAELKQKCDDEKDEIERLKVQLSQQETSNKTQAEELAKLQDQLQQLRKEEQEFKQKVELGKAELEKLQKASNNLNSEITQVQQRIEGLKEEHQSLTTALTLYPPTGSAPNPTHSAVVNINDVGKLSAELHVPHLSEHDAISARATAGSSSPVSSLSGFSTNSHLDEGAEEGAGGGAKEDKSHPDPFSSAGGSTRDPFAAFTLPTSDAGSFSSSTGKSFNGRPSDLSAFDPFGSGTPNFDPFKSVPSSSSVPATGEELFGGNDPFSGGSSSHISNSSSVSSLPTSAAAMAASTAPPPAVDPFSGQDPFNSDPFGSTTATTKESTQPTSLWGGSTPFDVDPFGGQANIQTPTDPFSGADPFGEDPFKVGVGGVAATVPQEGGTRSAS